MRWAIVGKDDATYVSGGLNRYVQGLIEGLLEQGQAIRVHLSGRSDRAYTVTRAGGPLPLRLLKFFRAGLQSPPGTQVIDIHFALYGLPFIVGARARAFVDRLTRRSHSFPFVLVHFHGPWADESEVAQGGRSSVATRVKRYIERSVLRQADQVIVLSGAFAEVAKSLGARGENVTIMPPGLNSTWLREGDRPEHSPSSPLNLLCVRRLTPRMGHLELLTALESLDFSVDGRDVRLTIVGTGDHLPAISAWVSAHGRGSAVTLTGRLSDDDLIATADRCSMAVVPTLELEGFGMVVLEAMALGLPVISTGQGGLIDAMGPWGIPPFVFDLRDSDSLRLSILAAAALSNDPEQVEELVLYARSHDWSSVAQKTRELVVAR